MRRKIVAAAAAGAIGVTGFALVGPSALAAVGAPEAGGAVDSRVDRIKDALSGLVQDKTITQEQADKVAEKLGSTDLRPGGPGGPGMRDGHGGPGGGFGGDVDAAATALGMTRDELLTAVRDGKSLADVAKEQKVDVTVLVDKLVAAATTRVNQAVKDGRLTQARADEVLMDLKARITERVNDTMPGPGRRHGGRGPGGPVGPSAIPAPPTPSAPATPSSSA